MSNQTLQVYWAEWSFTITEYPSVGPKLVTNHSYESFITVASHGLAEDRIKTLIEKQWGGCILEYLHINVEHIGTDGTSMMDREDS